MMIIFYFEHVTFHDDEKIITYSYTKAMRKLLNLIRRKNIIETLAYCISLSEWSIKRKIMQKKLCRDFF